METRSLKELTVVGKIDGSPSTVEGLLDGCQIISLSLVLVEENNSGRMVVVLGQRMCIL